MSQLSIELNKKKRQQSTTDNKQELNGFISNSSVYVTSINEDGAIEAKPSIASPLSRKSQSTIAKPTIVIPNGVQPERRKENLVTTEIIIENQHKLEKTDIVTEKSEKEAKEIVNSEKSEKIVSNKVVECEVKIASDKSGVCSIGKDDVFSVAREHLSNGRTEKLIGEQPDNRTRTASVADNKLGIIENRPRRRSGSSIVVVDAEEKEDKPPADDVTDDMLKMLSISADTGPHREMAVDVPESFIARSKTPPRYPPPRPPQVPDSDSELLLSSDSAATSYSSTHSARSPATSGTASCASGRTGSVRADTADGVAYSVRTESVDMPVLLGREVAVDVPDGFVQIVKTTPKYPGTVDRKSVSYQNGAKAVPAPAVPPREPARDAPPRPPLHHEPTREQRDTIKKYQEQLRQRKEAEERIAAQNEFLRTSLRGSHKLHALEAQPPPHAHAFLNDAYDEDSEAGEDPDQVDDLYKTVDYSEVSAALARVQAALAARGEAALAGRVSAVAGSLLCPALRTALATRHAVLSAARHKRAGLAPPLTHRAADRLKDCADAAAQAARGAGAGAALAAQLCTLLGGLQLESLVQAHDQAAALLEPACFARRRHKTGNNVNHKGEEDKTTAASPDDADHIKLIKIEKTNEPLGATVRNEGDAVIIGRVVRGGAAEKSGLLLEGDELLEVNGLEMRGKSVNTVCQLLGNMTGTLSMLVARAGAAPAARRDARVLHVRAHFDYDPEDDIYIPCRELGISFQKGDVLHVISREDPNWWQAFREGEEDQSLAGLIPSQTFQHQRESMKLSLVGEVGAREKPRKGGTLLCAKKPPRKKKSKKASSEAGYPLYATTGPDEYDSEEILTYEEVALYYPRASHKRPIVLIGPPNIGRHELRQRLMEDGGRFAAAVPHTSRPRKENEVPGQDYHFISRSQFEADILNRKFVEHGEYEKAYYGTSLEAIRAVVNSGKICVLNLHPQSLKILRNSDLKPYTVLVAPPSLEKLRQKKIRNGEAFKEEELKEIIATARDMEIRWGHLFDMIIINNDTQRAYTQLLNEINSLEREPQWVPAHWLKQT